MSARSLRLVVGASLCVSLGSAAETGQQPSVGESVVINDIRVTLLEVRRLSEDEYFEATGAPPPEWAGGGLVVLVENRPGAPTAPVLGAIRVIVGSKPYNAVTNATSTDPFAPDVMIHAVDKFFAANAGRQTRHPTPRPGTAASVLEIFVRGGTIPKGATGTVELEQGESWFKFRLPRIE
jgi:hypothetical protein